MTAIEPDSDTWQRLFASLIGDPAVDAAAVRGFCYTHGVTPARVMTEMQAQRRVVQQEQ